MDEEFVEFGPVKRNINVSMYEKQKFIGGNLIGASLIYEPYKKLLNYYQASIKNKLIDVHLNKEIILDDIEKKFSEWKDNCTLETIYHTSKQLKYANGQAHRKVLNGQIIQYF